MYWFTFGNILISLFFIIIAYVIISNQIEPRSKIIIIVFVTILGIMVLMNMTLFKSSNSLVSKTSDAKKTIIIPKDNLLKSSGNYSVSMWIYIEDWNYKFGEKIKSWFFEAYFICPECYKDYKSHVPTT